VCFLPSSIAALLRSAVIWTAAVNAAMRPSPSTPAAPGTAPSAKPTLATSGLPDAIRNCCPVNYVHVVFTIPHQLSWLAPRYPFFLPVKVLGRVFRGKFAAGLKQAFGDGKLRNKTCVQTLCKACLRCEIAPSRNSNSPHRLGHPCCRP
jgi:hypothetical protein